MSHIFIRIYAERQKGCFILNTEIFSQSFKIVHILTLPHQDETNILLTVFCIQRKSLQQLPLRFLVRKPSDVHYVFHVIRKHIIINRLFGFHSYSYPIHIIIYYMDVLFPYPERSCQIILNLL